MQLGTVAHENLSPYLQTVAEEMYSSVEPAYVRHFERAFGLLGNAPEHAERLLSHYFGIWINNRLGPRITELARLAIAGNTGCELSRAVRYCADVDEIDVAAIPALDGSALAPNEQAVVRFASAFSSNHLQIGDTHFGELKRYFDDGEIAELMLWCSITLGLGRMLKVAQIVDAELPLAGKTPIRLRPVQAAA